MYSEDLTFKCDAPTGFKGAFGDLLREKRDDQTISYSVIQFLKRKQFTVYVISEWNLLSGQRYG